MKKVSRLFAGFAAIALFTACSSEEPIDGGKQPGNTGKPVGDTAYMTINISDVNDFTAYGAPKGRSTTDGGYEDGSYEEHKVNDAQFFFFDENGVFVLKGQMVSPDFTDENINDENIEYMGANNILVLEGLTDKGWPSYMVTVLNAPDFEPASTIQATSEALDTYYRSLDSEDGKSNFMVMSTSSYFTAGTVANHDNKFPYATKLETTDFYTTPAEATADGKAVKVYVERLAAKVQLDVTAGNKTTYTDEKGDRHTIYKLTQTVAGDANDQENTDNKATTDLYIEVLGWNLNGTASKAYMSKQLKADWATTAPYTGWDKPEYFRSFWAKSALYGQNPVADVTADPSQLGLVYTTFGAASKAEGESDYCNENTNDAESIFATNIDDKLTVVPSQTTHVVLKARVCAVDGTPVDMVSYHGVLYLKSHYIRYVLDNIERGDKANLNFYTLTGENEYTQVAPEFFTLAADGSGKTGQVKVIVADETATLYARDSEGGYTAADGLMASLKEKLAAAQPDASSQYQATAYTGGDCVYYIPVEHNTAAGAGKEGYYGVVRNHWYRLNVTSFSKVGFGVYDPDNEVLIPEGPQDSLYYLGVNINVLSWKIVNQNVDL
ncbi:MAG: Mfa1 family fimbria major subunit [Muribaculaceae bacterium]|nr:Mfa1 family fimbria major subunit [Muribaculaceae bacterium]